MSAVPVAVIVLDDLSPDASVCVDVRAVCALAPSGISVAKPSVEWCPWAPPRVLADVGEPRKLIQSKDDVRRPEYLGLAEWPDAVVSARTFQQLRRPRQRWIALWAVLGMLLNQIALAEHLCREVRGLQGTHTHVMSDAGAMSAGCTAAPEGKAQNLPDLSQIACSAHCDDADKQFRDVVAPIFPALAGAGSEVALLRHERCTGLLVGDPRIAGALRDRHGSIYRVLLI